jgi:DNA-binding response OmpR family regulator
VSTPFPTAIDRHSQGRVLLVEDDPDAALFFTHVLARRGGFDVTSTADPAAALDLVTRGPWDLVVTDYDLPGMTGLALLAAIRVADPVLPVLLVTASEQVRVPMRMLSPDALLAKPVHSAELVATAAALIAR